MYKAKDKKRLIDKKFAYRIGEAGNGSRTKYPFYQTMKDKEKKGGKEKN